MTHLFAITRYLGLLATGKTGFNMEFLFKHGIVFECGVDFSVFDN